MPSTPHDFLLSSGEVARLFVSTTLRAIARRWQQLNVEIARHEKVLAQLTTHAAPDLRGGWS